MYSYKMRRSQPAYEPMPIELRAGLVPKQGFSSIRPAKEPKDALRASAKGFHSLIFGDPLKERISLSHEALQIPNREEVPQAPEIADILPSVRELLLAGKGMEAAALSVEIAKDRGYGDLIHFHPNDSRNIELPLSIFHSIGAMNISMDIEEAGKPYNYLRSHDFASGQVTIYWTDQRGDWTRKTFVSESHDCLIQLITGPEDFNLKLSYDIPREWEPRVIQSKVSYGDNTISCEAKHPVGPGGHALASLIASFGGHIKAKENYLECTGSKKILIISKIKVMDNFSPGISSKLLDEMSKLSGDYDDLLASHQALHSPRMEACQLELCSEEENMALEELMELQAHTKEVLLPKLLQISFDAGRYFLATNMGKYPPLKGQWNINVNLQVCSGNITGLHEMMDVFFDFVEDKLPDFRVNAKNILGCQGIMADIHPEPNNGLLYHFSRTYPHHYWTACAGWIYNEFWGRYLVSGDEDFLRDRILPGLREIALFYIDFLKDKDSEGNYIFYPCWSPENEPLDQSPVTINAVMDIMVCREVMENLLEAQRILGIEDKLKEKYQDILSHLPTLLLDHEGGLKEWAWDAHPERFNHRHVSHHYDVWPGMKVRNRDMPELALAILKSNRKRGQQDDSAHGILHRLFTAIRLNQPDDTVFFLQQLFRQGFINYNMTSNHFPYRMEFPDMLGAMPAVFVEMLVGSRPGEIIFFQALPDFLSKGQLSGAKLYSFISLNKMDWSIEKGYINAVLLSHKDQWCRIDLEGYPEYKLYKEEEIIKERKIYLKKDSLTRIRLEF